MTIRSTEARHPAAQGLHRQPAAQAMALLLEAQRGALAALVPAIPALGRAAEAGVAALRGGGRMGYAGAGSSGLMALADCLELPGTFGLAPDRTPMLFAGGPDALLRMHGGVEDDPALALADLDRAGLGRGDALLVVSASGTTPYALAVATAARARGVTVTGIANVAGSALLDAAEIAVLLDTGAEMVAGSTRMGAATAQKVALNMISVMVGIGLGHVHDGQMVNLIADNAKLVDRAARIVAELAGVPRPEAEAALARTGGAVKPAILVARGAAPDTASDALRDSGGHLAPLMG
ncbi:N-acetylmuramic acid 6-phosphate etherase [Paracoccus spongiarum]|uniref:N-acetylmuramic acid 6-phosphate etherase n=1 Tax=Paracoccus spongiarum TaxID=3064387 RepID=A0ABT9JED3_9RHOB|nr:N-acetylmuramic acid 6-phosphate etherase [Paracoccus sp. 2205BS29-5]MDP5308186.1 N-acetylmuramic acid 6-phosphate etherase [Paracoccus sp. 2205BS29-5]